MNSYPPFLDQVHKHCPNASLIYTKFWRERDKNGNVVYEKKKVTKEDCISWKTFTESLRKLKSEEVIDFKFVDDDNVVVKLFTSDTGMEAA